VINGEGTLQGGQRFDGAEIVEVVPGSPGATAGLKGTQLSKLITLGIEVAWLVCPPTMIVAAAFESSGIAESHDFIIAVDGERVYDIIEFGGTPSRRTR
jgi:S1-C subfamily serine protease